MKTRKSRVFACDFETTVYKGQVNTEVWASASVELFTEDVKIFHSIEEQFDYFKSLDSNVLAYYHNLKFDGAFWLSFLMIDLKYTQAGTTKDGKDMSEAENADDFIWEKQWNMPSKSFQYSISDMGQWYRIIIKLPNEHYIEIRDSLKLLPFSVKRIGESFKTKHKKLEMEYTGFRYAGCEITKEEQKYIANDVLVVKEALEIMFEEGHKKITIGSCCLEEFKSTLTPSEYQYYFPNLYEYKFNDEEKKIYNADSIGTYIRKSYRGGWCYLVPEKANKIYNGGTTADVNSLYPSMMHSESGNFFPIGLPTFWRGNLIPSEALNYDSYFFVRIRTRFYLKDGKLPFIQIKSSTMYKGTKSLETSDIEIIARDKNGKKIYDENGKPVVYYTDEIEEPDGTISKATVELTLTCTDYRLIKEHYDLCDFEILDGCYFKATIGIFDEYINKYREMKLQYKGARRELAKLFLNNLYGKTASAPDSDFKVAFVKEDKSIGFRTVVANDKIPGYIPVGSAITSYARNFTIRAAQMNYHGKDKRGFIYADTDSIHCDLKPEEILGIKVDDKKFCCWKLESCWDEGFFVRQKTYIEHITHENCIPVEQLEKPKEPFYNVKCAGMPQKCKDLFLLSMGEKTDLKELEFNELKFAVKDRTINDFKIGLIVPGKLLPKRIMGGVLLVDTPYEMR